MFQPSADAGTHHSPPTTMSNLTIDQVIAAAPLATENIHGGATLKELSAALGTTTAEVDAVLMSAWRVNDYRVNAWGDQNPALTPRQFQRAELYYFRTA